ncbi:mfs transporter : Major facilitator superfamily MFS_1 OS=Chthoniobacter flavus Ellin428 GN=CfE428DRAFT_5659 PE=4 SV=1: MFS_1 [Gemmataceae bacterium]|nr:mfs transporter : Major facilitator superfamily MFS_1 OS=Chthoniobacter flavus Ellin428 GN=CfE428DRAFT_5659 PE=4 SV=1: MFS_1 [Gemmataceae bacterium]VTU00147.1 mfs transporter : Major facilitator superfamily MFS_1 OS=Chthoniobacter flavus Ellin428 GN=CfE428DRAFT_5659 PE=4 SV=1: MFS_1 [Gemmataceae bacterium]
MPGAAATSTHGGPSRPVPGAGWALALLLGINLFNYIDRQILSATLPKIRLDATILAPDDPLAQTKLGALTTAFMVAYMCLSPLFGRLGDTVSRWGLVGVAVILWSLATGGTGLATGYLALFFARCLVGVGEAAYGPVAPAMLSDLYPVDHRGRIMAWFYMAIPVGSALGFVVGSQVAEHFGWRTAFHVAVFPGIALGVLCFFMRDTRGGTPAAPDAAPVATSEPAPSYWAVLRELKGVRSFVLCCAGMTASTFVLGGVATMVQLYLFEREARFTLNEAAVAKLEAITDSTGERVVPAAVADKLRAATWPAGVALPEFREKLRATLTEQEFTLYSSWVFDSSPAEGSLTNGTIGLYFGAIVVLSGLFATLLGGMLGDYLRNRGVKGAYFHVAGWGMIAAFPAYVAMLYVPFPVGWVLIFVAVFFLFFNTGPANTILANVTRSKVRATAFAINILIIHALGDAISPPILGLIADYTSLQTAFLSIAFLVPLSGVLWIWGAKHLDEDTAKAEAAS